MPEEASSLALVELLRQRNLTLDQQIRDVVQRNKSLEQQLDAQHREAARKRRKLQRKIQEAQNALRLKDEGIRRLQRQLSETIDALDAEKDRTGKLQQLEDDEADRSLMESALRAAARHQHTECEPRIDISCSDKPGWGDFDTPEDTGDQYQKKELGHSLFSREEDVAVTLTKIIPQLCGSRDDREQQGGYVDSRHHGIVPNGCIHTDEYVGEASKQGLTQLLKEAGEALNAHQETRWHDMMEREKVLTCPLSQDLFQDAVVTECCGKTASWEPLRQALAQISVCPFCNAKEGYVHRNADMETLVELHRSERSALSDIAFITARTAAHLTVACSRPSQRVDAVLLQERPSERDESTGIYRLPSAASSAKDIDDDAGGDSREEDTSQWGSNARTASPTTGESDAPNISPSTLSRPPASIDARRTCRYLFEPSAALRVTLETPGKSHRKDPDAASGSSFRSPVSSGPTTASLTAWAHEFSRPRKRRAAEEWRFPECA